MISIILAAGASSRMGFPKPLLLLRGRPVLSHLIELHKELGHPVKVVLGAGKEDICAAVDLSGVDVVVNPEPAKGPISSLLLALKGCGQASGALVHPVDHPGVRRKTLRALAESHQNNPESILVPVWNGRRGHPVVFPKHFFEVLGGEPARRQGARAVVAAHPRSVIEIGVDDPAVLRNVNTRGDWEAMLDDIGEFEE